MNNCLVCSDKLQEFGKKGGFFILKCPRCGLGITKNLKVQSSNYHRDDIYLKEESLFKNIFLKRVNLICKFKKAGKVLEVGCSTGLMLSLFLKRGWQVRGIEISQQAAQVAQQRGIEVVVNLFEKVTFKEKFDVIIFNHTLEHMENPVKVLQKSLSLLEDNGLLYVDIPNFGGLSAQLLKADWSLLLPAEHKWHFTYKALEILLKRLEFKIIFSDRSSGVWDYENPIQGVFQSLISFKKRFFNELITMIPSFLVSKLNMGSNLMVISKKL